MAFEEIYGLLLRQRVSMAWQKGAITRLELKGPRRFLMWKGCSGISKNQFSDFRSMYLENYVEVSEYELTFLLNNIQCPRKL